MVEQISNKENLVPTEEVKLEAKSSEVNSKESAASTTKDSEQQPEKPKGGELLTFGVGLKSKGGL